MNSPRRKLACAATPGARGPSPVAALNTLLDELIATCGQTDGAIVSSSEPFEGPASDLAMARKQSDERRGRVFEDEALWEPWSQAFLEWYIIERVPPTNTMPPAVEQLAREREPDRAAVLRALCTSHRSLFEVRGLTTGVVELHDLLGGGSFRVAEERTLHGVGVGDIAELRLVGFSERVLFARTFCYHPTGTREAITGHARRIRASGGDRRDVMDYCAKLRIRCERYRHVPPLRVYEAATQELFRGPGEL